MKLPSKNTLLDLLNLGLSLIEVLNIKGNKAQLTELANRVKKGDIDIEIVRNIIDPESYVDEDRYDDIMHEIPPTKRDNVDQYLGVWSQSDDKKERELARNYILYIASKSDLEKAKTSLLEIADCPNIEAAKNKIYARGWDRPGKEVGGKLSDVMDAVIDACKKAGEGIGDSAKKIGEETTSAIDGINSSFAALIPDAQEKYNEVKAKYDEYLKKS